MINGGKKRRFIPHHKKLNTFQTLFLTNKHSRKLHIRKARFLLYVFTMPAMRYNVARVIAEIAKKVAAIDFAWINMGSSYNMRCRAMISKRLVFPATWTIFFDFFSIKLQLKINKLPMFNRDPGIRSLLSLDVTFLAKPNSGFPRVWFNLVWMNVEQFNPSFVSFMWWFEIIQKGSWVLLTTHIFPIAVRSIPSHRMAWFFWSR